MELCNLLRLLICSKEIHFDTDFLKTEKKIQLHKNPYCKYRYVKFYNEACRLTVIVTHS